MKRGSVTKSESKLLGVWMPEGTFLVLDKAVEATDLDRSKFVRAAIREKIERVFSKLKETKLSQQP